MANSPNMTAQHLPRKSHSTALQSAVWKKEARTPPHMAAKLVCPLPSIQAAPGAQRLGQQHKGRQLRCQPA